jgi:formylglycine-generating enzyme required for sulfatase activity
MLPVGSRKPNDLGLFDMLGNAMEWCQEQILDYRLTHAWSDDKEDLESINTASSRVLRGGSFRNRAVYVRSASRSRFVPSLNDDVCFRPARTFR